jgi:hypothetical protein
MSISEAGQALFVVVIIGLVNVVLALALRNARLKRERELLSRQLAEMRTGEAGKPATGKRVEGKVTEGKITEPAAPEAQKTVAQPATTPLPFPSPPAARPRSFADTNVSCPDCGSTDFEMRTYGGSWEYADTHCARCGKLILRFDQNTPPNFTVRRIV